MNIKNKLKLIEDELTDLSGQAYLLNQKMPNDVIAQFKEKVLLPLKSLTAYAENLEESINCEVK